MGIYLGDFRTGKTIRFGWNSNAVAGESITRSTNGTISVYKDGGTTQSTTGVTDTEDFDSLTGVHLVAIDTSADGTFYSAGSDFMVVLSAATVDGKTINAVLGQFSLEARSALMPTTDGRKLDVSATGEAGLDWGNIGSPTTAQNLSGTNIDPDQVVASVTGAVGSVAAGGITASSIAADAIGASELAADAVAEIADAVWDEARAGHVNAGSFGEGVASVQGNVTGSVDSVVDPVTVGTNNDKTGYELADGAITAAKIATGAIDADAVAADAVSEIQSGLALQSTLLNMKSVVDTITTQIGAFTGAGTSTVFAWLRALLRKDVAVPADIAGTYDPATDSLEALQEHQAAIKAKTDLIPTDPADASDLTAQFATVNTKLDTIDDLIDTEVAAIKTKTDNLPDDPASEASLAVINANVLVIDDLLDTEVAAIKAKTDLIPASPAAVGSAMTLDLTQALDETPVTGTVGDALAAARAQGFGKWAIVGTTLNIYASDGATVIKAFTLDDADAPTSRTPV